MKKLFQFLIVAVSVTFFVAGCGFENDPSSEDDSNTTNTAAFTSDGAMKNGVFTVAEGKTVRFSRGNLQYQPYTRAWRFALHQFDIIGNDNTHVTDSAYTGYMDLFSWGVGTDPMYFMNNEFNNQDMPFVDWGENAIVNGGGEANLWRTPSIEEWDYMLYKRPNAENLYAFVEIRNTKHAGLMILPDGDGIETFEFTPGFHGAGTNVITMKQWYKAQEEGAVMLPLTGYAPYVNTTNSYTLTSDHIGFYWTSTPKADDGGVARRLDFYSDHIFTVEIASYPVGYAVRLVQDVK